MMFSVPLGWFDPDLGDYLPHYDSTKGPKSMTPEQWPRKGDQDQRRTAAGKPDPTGRFKWTDAKFTPTGVYKVKAKWELKGLISQGTRVSEAGTGARAERDSSYEERFGLQPGDAARLREERNEEREGGRRESRGPGSWGSSRACCEMLGRRGTDPVTGEAIQANTCLPHIVAIAMGNPNGSDFTFGTAAPSLSVDAQSHRQWIEAPEVVEERNAVAQRFICHFGPPVRSASLPACSLTTSLRVYLSAVRAGKVYMLVDAESHRLDDSSSHWKAGDVYDLAVTLVDSKSGSTVAVLFQECNRFGKLDAQSQARAIAAIRSRPDTLCCAWGHGPEWKWAIEPAGRRKPCGSDGIDIKEAILRVMPAAVRRAASAVGNKRWSMSQNLWVPVMGLRHTAYHKALPDCITEGIVSSALGRALMRVCM